MVTAMLVHSSSLVAARPVKAADLGKLCGVEASAADEGPVDVGLGHDPDDVARLDRSAVQDAGLVGEVTAVQLGQPRPDGGTDLLRVLGRRDLAGADRPHRLV